MFFFLLQLHLNLHLPMEPEPVNTNHYPPTLWISTLQKPPGANNLNRCLLLLVKRVCVSLWSHQFLKLVQIIKSWLTWFRCQISHNYTFTEWKGNLFYGHESLDPITFQREKNHKRNDTNGFRWRLVIHKLPESPLASDLIKPPSRRWTLKSMATIREKVKMTNGLSF